MIKEESRPGTTHVNRLRLRFFRRAQAFENYAHNGDNAALKRCAVATLPHLQELLAMAEKLSAR
jgi:hypothetical protein